MTPAQSAQLDSNLAFVQGDTWGGIPSATFTPAPNYALSLVRMHFRDSFVSTVTRARLSSDEEIPDPPGTNQIEITNASDWIFMIPPQKLGLKAGKYVWQIEFVDVEGNIQTYMQGNIEVFADIVRPAA